MILIQRIDYVVKSMRYKLELITFNHQSCHINYKWNHILI